MHCQIWKQTCGVQVSISTMSCIIRRMGWTRKKKTLGATERNEEARAAWREQRTRGGCEHSGRDR
ncbi:MAG TPA: winged helix-turn-helix domain-containing protein [Ktedonosporobacter sp.]|nr:winged helix-turn-helix domain-containing protein [Ktedonosporobacter sp.]